MMGVGFRRSRRQREEQRKDLLDDEAISGNCCGHALSEQQTDPAEQRREAQAQPATWVAAQVLSRQLGLLTRYSGG